MKEDQSKQTQVTPPADGTLDALKAGDRTAFAHLVEQYSPQVYRLALKILNDAQDAEDVLQETFIKVLKGLPSFEGRSSLTTWMYRIAVNEALMVLRKRRPEPVSIDQTADDGEGETDPVEIVDWCCLPESELMDAEARHFLDGAIQGLTPPLRAVFLLRDVEGLSINETAEALGVTEMAVKTRLLRARLKLREALSVYYGERLSEKSTK